LSRPGPGCSMVNRVGRIWLRYLLPVGVVTVRGNGLPGSGAQLAWGCSGGGSDVGETCEELVDGGLAIFNGGALVVGERDRCRHALQVVLGLDGLACAGYLRSIEVAAGTCPDAGTVRRRCSCSSRGRGRSAAMAGRWRRRR